MAKHKKTEFVAFRLTDEQKSYLDAVAQEDDRSVSWVIQKLIDWFRVNKTPKQAVQSVKETYSDN